MLRRSFFASAVAMLFSNKLLAKPYYSRDSVAANGHDVVSYFTENKPVPGDPALSVDWDGAVWYFSSKENLELFTANAAAYAPQYGGWCAFAMSQNSQAPTVPEAFTVHNNKLYLNYSLGVRDRWTQDKEENIRLADGHWPNYRE